MREEDVHQQQRRDVKRYPDSKNPPSDPAPKDGEREYQLPNENESDRQRQVTLYRRQFERKPKIRVVQVVERMQYGERRQVV